MCGKNVSHILGCFSNFTCLPICLIFVLKCLSCYEYKFVGDDEGAIRFNQKWFLRNCVQNTTIPISGFDKIFGKFLV